MMTPSRWILILLALGGFGCSGTSVGNPPGADVKLAAAGTIEDLPPVSQKQAPKNSLSGGITVSSVWVVLRGIDLRESGSCAGTVDDASRDAPGAYAADLLTGTIYPEAPRWERLGGESYCALDLTMGPLPSPIEGAPVELVEGGAYVEGARADGTPFEVRVPIDEELRLGALGKPEFVLGEGPVGLLATFTMNAWLNPSLLDQAVIKDGSIVADDAENAEIAESVRLRIPESARLMRDKDRDGALSEEDGEL
jgi:hypothetical protein